LITSPDTKTWTAAIDRRLRAIVTRGRLPTSHRPFLGRQVERARSAGGGNQQQNKFDASTESVEATHAWLPIGPSCC
jgi:hypothetical protein